ncbi:hypothetical protein AWM75_06190 [Aerococcus urinaehominis]|uniref:Uncharacterized protein n=1 Tax=Aerococcus urinaehominis TaxID=128944 RepID=A0A109RH25_9LACT|nr:DUF4430 domain-containing protein [Aerococcus urinaehominis]AMB99594.1 hypothetical protein AWM75_06190 [Aerococcus urinaehominis]SDL86789.1 protein of unknown function [Aerococcus urinaehominis]
MRKKLVSLFSIVLVLAACAGQPQTASEAASQAKTSQASNESALVAGKLDIQVDGQSITSGPQEHMFDSNLSLLDNMQQWYEIEGKEGFIETIEGQSQDEAQSRYWLYTVNGEMVNVGADEYYVQAGDVIIWNLASI